MRKTFLRLGSLLALVAVVLGAFGSHSLKEAISPEQLNTFEIGVRYQFYHALATVAVGLLLYSRKARFLPFAGWFFVAGVLLFSGSLYLLSVQDILNISTSWIGPVTPLGGLLFILGWAAFFISTYQKNERAYRSKSRKE